MDPLFGFVDDVVSSEQNQQGTTGTTTTTTTTATAGEYTISYSTDPTQNFQIQGNPQLQFNNASAGQVLHVMSDNQNDKQIYVIKLENILKSEEINQSGEESVTQQIMNVSEMDNQQHQAEVKLPEETPASESEDVSTSDEDDKSEKEEEEEAEEEEEEEVWDPSFGVLPESVVAMGMSVGVDLSEQVACDLAVIATNRIRHALMIALQFSQNENSEGLQVEHFSKAEEQLNSSNLGHESAFKETPFKYAGGVSVLDDGPEIDLYTSIRQTNMSEVLISFAEPVLNVHHLISYDSKSERNNSSSNFQLYEEPIVQCCGDGEVTEGDGDEKNDNDSEVRNEPRQDLKGIGTVESKNSEALKEICDPGSSVSFEPAYDQVLDDNEDIENLADDYMAAYSSSKSNSNHNNSQQLQVPRENLQGDMTDAEGSDLPKSERFDEFDEVAPEWKSYLQVLIEQVVAFHHDHDYNIRISSDLQKILRDIRSNGAHPILHIVCDSFRDYLKDSTLTRGSLMNIISVVDAFMSSQCHPTLVQLSDLGSVLIEIISLPPPCEIHQFLANVFMKILKNCNELLTWTCTYVTEMLKGISETAIDQLNDPLKSAMHGALCLANGLEILKIQVAQEFGWHTSVLLFSTNHCNVFDGASYSPTNCDSYLEEEIFRFYHNFINSYTTLVAQTDLARMREVVSGLYGERFSTFVHQMGGPISVKHSWSASATPAASKKTRCVFRKITYKDKEIIVPFRKCIQNAQ